LNDGTSLPCGVFLAAVGIRPNIDLAAVADLAVNRGVLVDDRMQTSVPGVFAAGDVAEHNDTVSGLWPIAAKQAEVAAINALGGNERLIAELPVTILKGVGLDVATVGRAEAGSGDQVIVIEDPGTYRRLVLTDGHLVGTVLLGHHPRDLAAATAAVKKRLHLDDEACAAAQVGDWSVLTRPPAPDRALNAVVARPG